MCDAIRERPRPGTELYTYWHGPVLAEGELTDLDMGEWTLRVRVIRVKDSQYVPNAQHVTVEVLW